MCIWCVKLKEGCGTGPQMLWRMLQKTHSVGSPFFFFMKGLTSLEFNDHVMGCGFFGGHFLSCLGHTGAACRWGTHLGQNLVQPLQGTIQMQLDPARSACDSLPPGKEDIHFNVWAVLTSRDLWCFVPLFIMQSVFYCCLDMGAWDGRTLLEMQCQENVCENIVVTTPIPKQQETFLGWINFESDP